MKKKLLLVIAFMLILTGCNSTSTDVDNYYHSKKLVSAIEDEDVVAVKAIIEEHPDCINTYPSAMPDWLHSFLDLPRVCFPLTVACATDNLEVVTILLQNGADPNCNDGLTPLSVTYSGKCDNWYEISKTLIEYGAKLDYVTDYSGGKVSVFRDIVKVRAGAALPGYEAESEEEVLEAFNDALENCDLSNVDWMSVLQRSVSNGRIEIVKLLLEQKYCDVNDTSIDMTALMFAARDSTVEMVQLLLDYGADKSQQTLDGKTAYDYAVEFNTSDVVELLETHEQSEQSGDGSLS